MDLQEIKACTGESKSSSTDRKEGDYNIEASSIQIDEQVSPFLSRKVKINGADSSKKKFFKVIKTVKYDDQTTDVASSAQPKLTSQHGAKPAL